MRLILVRHGETGWNREGRILGRSDIGLSEWGRIQAHAIVQALQRERLQAVYCSPLRRAVETGRMISNDQRCPLILDPDLQERGRGNLEGMVREEALRAYPEWGASGGPEGFNTPDLYGQESLNSLALRVRGCLDRIKARHMRETVALVGHYFVNLMILCGVLGMKPRHFRNLSQDLAGISIAEIEKDRSRICRLNDTSHLPKG